jgi:hypothetical protein
MESFGRSKSTEPITAAITPSAKAMRSDRLFELMQAPLSNYLN